MALNASIVPAISDFSVSVNSVTQTITSISISGTKVLLTLSSAVKYGDVASVTYTKPSTNPLQTVSGGIAASYSTHSVTNNVSATPVLKSIVVEDAAPTLLVISYDLALSSSIVPAISAFSVSINSVTQTIRSISISGTTVLLTLSSTVKYGDVATVTYTKPSTNPLQTVAGGLAASYSAYSVTNNVQKTSKTNDPPVIVVNSESSVFSGFISKIDASDTYDPNDDFLKFTWTVPSNISVNSTSTSSVEFLSPWVTESQVIVFQLRVTDGSATVSKSISINVVPYKSELTAATIAKINSSGYQSSNYPSNITDGNTSTVWSADGNNQWLTLKLATPFKIDHLVLAFLQGQQYESYFEINASKDSLTWDPVLLDGASCGFSGGRQVFDFPASDTSKKYSYLKYIGHGNSLNTSNIISEFNIFGTPQSNSSSDNTISVYPNPVKDVVNIKIGNLTLDPDKVRIADLSGKIVYEDKVSPDTKIINIPISIGSGIYIVNLSSGKFSLVSRKFVVVN